MGLGEHRSGADAFEPGASLLDDQRQARAIERNLRAAGQRDAQRGLGRGLRHIGGFLRDALAGSFFAIEHIGARHLVMLAAHQRQFDLVLHVLDMKGAALADSPRQRADDLGRQLLDDLVHAAGGGGGVALDREKGLGHRDRNLAGVEFRNRAVAADHLHRQRAVLRGRRFGAQGEKGSGFGFGRNELRRLRHRQTPWCCWGWMPGGDAASNARAENAGMSLQATAGTPRPWTLFRCRGRSPGSQVIVAPGLPNAVAASVT